MSPDALIADDLPLPLLVISADANTIIWANQSAQEWLGLSLSRLTKKSLDTIFVNADAIKQAGARCRQDLAPVSLNNFDLQLSEMPNDKGHVTLFPSGENIGFSFQTMGAKPNPSRTGDFAVSAMGRMLAHEIKNPLAGIDGAAQLLALDIEGEESHALINLIRSEINRIRRLADRMESLGDSDPTKSGPIDVHDILGRARLVIENAAPENITIVEKYDPSLPPAIGDEDTLMQALLNLIKNAAEAIEAAGRPGRICLETSFRSGVTRRNEENGDHRQLPIEIRIIDDGPGVPDTMRNRLFQPFITNKPAGQGLGLALVSKVASAHGGLIELESRPGRTVFSILLPVTSRTMPPEDIL